MKYPGGSRPKGKPRQEKNPSIEYGNRGMDLEKEINISNRYYIEIDRALIYKKPTPIKLQEVEYTKQGKVIKKAYFDAPSTTDYNGIYKGWYIDFEAKETKSTTSFPLKNIHAHQIEHMIKVCQHGGICFLIVRFTTLNKTYLLKAEDLERFLKDKTRNSIPLSFFEEYAYRIPDGYLPRLDYLKIVDKIYGGVENGKRISSQVE